ncbi:MAG: cysteine desulfurase [Nitrospinae bacterium]|nr:cysteine desulfurase [Nitrospinota bacterium]
MFDIYLDHNATTPLREEVSHEVMECMNNNYGNPSSIHGLGQKAKKKLTDSRETIAEFFNVKPSEIVFTSGGSESNNLALKGFNSVDGKNHIITSKIEHPSVIETCKYLESIGFSVTYLNVDSCGRVVPDELESAINNKTFLISLQHANNEIGTIQNLESIALIAHKYNLIFHVDAVQSIGKVPLNLRELNIDLLSASAHKINGPKGVGFLYINERLKKLTPLIHGGPQERKRRAGTINLPSIAGFAKAICLLKNSSINHDVLSVRNFFEETLLHNLSNVTINGDVKSRLHNTSSITFHGVDNEAVLISLDIKGICASAGSACSSGSIKHSPVLKAIGLSDEDSSATVRFSFGYKNSISDAKSVVHELVQIITHIRSIN